MKRRKRIIALLMAAAMTVSMMPMGPLHVRAEQMPGFIDFSALSHPDYIDAGTDVVVNYDGTKATVVGTDWGNEWGGDSHWQIQLKEPVAVTPGTEYDVSFTITSEVARSVFIKLGSLSDDNAVFGTETLQLAANQAYHFETTTEGLNVQELMVLFALGNQTDHVQNTITIENLSVTEHKESDTSLILDGNILNLEAVETELYVGNDWAGTQASLKEKESQAIIHATNFGWSGEWGLQYMVKELNMKAGQEYTLSCDLLSSVDKKVLVKLDDSGIIVDTLNLQAGQVYHYEKTATAGAVSNQQLYFALGQMAGEEANRAGDITISNVKLLDKDGNPAIEEKEENPVLGKEYDFSAVEDNNLNNFADPGKIKNGYDLIWSDEFDGNYGSNKVDQETGLNLNNWAYQLGDGSTDCGNYGWGNNELQAYTGNKKNVSVNEDLNQDGIPDGLLRITASYEKDGYVYGSESQKKYTSARIRTTSKTEALFTTTYGYVEARMSLPGTKGAWPAFWMLPQSTEVYGNWPVSGEIDIMETCGGFTNGKNDVACGTLHWGNPSHVYKGSGYVDLSSDYSYFHTYAIDWEPGKITWYYDGVAINTITNWESAIPGASDSLSYDAPFDMPFYILLNLAVDSGQFGGSANKATFKNDINMYVDYVRVFQKTDGYADSVDKTASSNSKEDWTSFAGQNQIADITASNVIAAENGNVNDLETSHSLVANSWYLGYQADAKDATVDTVVDNNNRTWAHLTIPTAGAQDYSVQLIGHYNAKKGYVYKISFDAYAKGGLVNKTVNSDSKEWAGWSTYGNKTFTLSSEPESFSYFVEQTDDFENCRLEFNVGARGTGEVFISNVKVEIVDPAELGIEDAKHKPLENGDYIYNGSFDQGSKHFGYWTAGSNTIVSIPRYTLDKLTDNDLAVKDVAAMSNYERITDGIKYYERRAQISAASGAVPSIYQAGLKLPNDSYKVKLDMYSEYDTVVTVGIYEAVENEDGSYSLGKLVTDLSKMYEAEAGVSNMIFDIALEEALENAAVVIAFDKDSEVQIDNVSMLGTKPTTEIDEHPMDENTTWNGDNGSGQGVPVEEADGIYTMKDIVSGKTWYSPQIISSEYALVSGQEYTFSFKYKLSGAPDNAFKYIIQENGSDWHVFNGSGPVEVTYNVDDADEDGFCTYTVTFVADRSIKTVHSVFGFGDSKANGAVFQFKDVSLSLTKDKEEAPKEDDTEEDGKKPEEPGDKPAPEEPGDKPAPEEPGDKPAPEEPGDKPAPEEPGDKPAPEEPGDKPAPEKPGNKPAPEKPGDKPAPEKPDNKPAPEVEKTPEVEETPEIGETPEVEETPEEIPPVESIVEDVSREDDSEEAPKDEEENKDENKEETKDQNVSSESSSSSAMIWIPICAVMVLVGVIVLLVARKNNK